MLLLNVSNSARYCDVEWEPDCSGSYETTSSTYTDYISFGASIYSVNFRIKNSDERIFVVTSYQQLAVD